MASLLYRIGAWCAAHTRRVVAAWLVLLVAVGALAATVGRPLTNEVRIPGSDFEQVLEEVQREVPAASGGFGAVVLRSDRGRFDADQRAAVEDVFAEWSDQPEVRTVIDPFANQDRIEEADATIADGAKQVSAGQERLDDSWVALSKGQGQVDYGRSWLRYFAKNDPSSPFLAQVRSGMREGMPQLAEGYGQWAVAAASLATGRADLADGRALRTALGDTSFVTDDGYALAQVQFDKAATSVDPAVKRSIPEIGARLAEHGVTAEYSVDITRENSALGPGEVVGVAVAAMVLLLALGSLVAAGLPLAGALVGVGVGLAAAIASTHFFDMHAMTPSLALMLGLAVGIDYALFIVNRHRTQLLASTDVAESIARAVGTAGSAVVVAGATVVIALVALLVTGVPILTQMGLVAAGTVAVAVLVALTLTPALLGAVGYRLLPRRRRAAAATPSHGDQHRVAGRHVALVTRRPGVVVAGVVALCAVLSVPALSLRLGLPDGSTEPRGTTGNTSFVQAAESFGPGTNGPIVAVARYREPLAEDRVAHAQAEMSTQLHAVGGVAAVAPFGVSDDRRTLAFQVVPTAGPADAETAATVKALQASRDVISQRTGARVGLTGQTVANIEISAKLGAALAPYLAIVVGLSLVLLMIVFRSILVPLIATAGFLLSVAVSFGATVAVYQWGWLGGLLQVDTPGPVLPFMPIMLVGVLFGLAMDYQMFLVAGMKEAHAHGEPARAAVRSGFVHGAKVVTAAAVIMGAVFAGFVFAHLTMIRPIGLALAVGVLVDALLVRMTLVPALMHLLDERAWAFPRWLDRLLPHLDVEGTSLEQPAPRPRALTPHLARLEA